MATWKHDFALRLKLLAGYQEFSHKQLQPLTTALQWTSACGNEFFYVVVKVMKVVAA